MTMNRKLAFVLVPLLFVLPSCGTLGGAFAGGAGGFGLTKLLGGNNTTAAAVGAGGAVVGGVLGHFLVDVPAAKKEAWDKRAARSTPIGEPVTTYNPDGSSQVSQQYYYRPAPAHRGYVYNATFVCSAPSQDEECKITDIQLGEFTPPSDELVAKMKDTPMTNVAAIPAPMQAAPPRRQ